MCLPKTGAAPIVFWDEAFSRDPIDEGKITRVPDIRGESRRPFLDIV